MVKLYLGLLVGFIIAYCLIDIVDDDDDMDGGMMIPSYQGSQ